MARTSQRARASAPPLLSHVHDGVAWLTLNRPERGNAISLALAQEIVSAVESIALDDGARLVVIEGAGRHFCVGVEDAGNWQRDCDWVAAIARLTAPVLAIIDGDALAEGCELALACDLRLVSPRARFQLPQIAQGRLPSHGATQRLPRLVGRMRAMDLLLTGRAVDAAEAEACGLATRVFPAKTFAREARRVVDELAAKGPIALRYGKEAVAAGLDLTLDQGIRLEQDLYVLLQTTADRAEGIRAFLEKRRPKFSGS
jgi:enoyl-CoA hydratase/carnithine racemase